MSGYLGDLSSIQEKSLDEFKEMLTAETTTDEVRCNVNVGTITVVRNLQFSIDYKFAEVCESRTLVKTNFARSVNCLDFLTDA